MPKRTKVYAVTYGAYSDYHVGPMFLSRGMAVEYAGPDNLDRIDEFELWDAIPLKLPWYTKSGFEPPYQHAGGIRCEMRDADDEDAARWHSIETKVCEDGDENYYFLWAEGPDKEKVSAAFHERWENHWNGKVRR